MATHSIQSAEVDDFVQQSNVVARRCDLTEQRVVRANANAANRLEREKRKQHRLLRVAVEQHRVRQHAHAVAKRRATMKLDPLEQKSVSTATACNINLRALILHETKTSDE